MATSNISQELAGEIRRWADLTVSICRSYDTPANEEERLIHCLLLSTHPDRYIWRTRIHHLVACLRAELQQAQRRPRPAPRNTTPIILPPNQPWPPWQSPAVAQPKSAQAPGTGAASFSLQPHVTTVLCYPSQAKGSTAGLHHSPQTQRDTHHANPSATAPSTQNTTAGLYLTSQTQRGINHAHSPAT